MKRLLLLLACGILLTACGNDHTDNNTDSSTTEETTSRAPAAMTPADSAKALLMEAQKYMEMGIRQQMTPAEANEKLKPVMLQFAEIYKRLPPADTLAIYQFRMQQFQEMVNLQVSMQQQQQKK